MAWNKTDQLAITAESKDFWGIIKGAQTAADQQNTSAGRTIFRVDLILVAEEAAQKEAARELAESKAREIAALVAERDNLRKQVTEARQPVKVDIAGIIPAPLVNVDLAALLQALKSFQVAQTVAPQQSGAKPQPSQKT